jgi:hypothetical protein
LLVLTGGFFGFLAGDFFGDVGFELIKRLEGADFFDKVLILNVTSSPASDFS